CLSERSEESMTEQTIRMFRFAQHYILWFAPPAILFPSLSVILNAVKNLFFQSSAAFTRGSGSRYARLLQPGSAQSIARHCEERSDAAI
ncbi:MAG: hypothetical protein K2H77_02985, partial [Alistipes sp.]|nr:hypothetical protein [Alistipes sp.]